MSSYVFVSLINNQYLHLLRYSAVNQVSGDEVDLSSIPDTITEQGHCHPRIVATLVEQAQKLTLSSRAFYNSVFGQYARKVTQMLGFDMVLPMNTGAEAVETAIKLSRKWAYEKKGVPEGRAIVFSAEGNFHGRTIGVIRSVCIFVPADPLLIISMTV